MLLSFIFYIFFHPPSFPSPHPPAPPHHPSRNYFAFDAAAAAADRFQFYFHRRRRRYSFRYYSLSLPSGTTTVRLPPRRTSSFCHRTLYTYIIIIIIWYGLESYMYKVMSNIVIARGNIYHRVLIIRHMVRNANTHAHFVCCTVLLYIRIRI